MLSFLLACLLAGSGAMTHCGRGLDRSVFPMDVILSRSCCPSGQGVTWQRMNAAGAAALPSSLGMPAFIHAGKPAGYRGWQAWAPRGRATISSSHATGTEGMHV